MLYVDGYGETAVISVISTFDNCGILDKNAFQTIFSFSKICNSARK